MEQARMQGGAVPIVKELVMVGGGHTHALVLRKWGMKPVPGVRLTVINPAPTAPYSGMLPGFIAGHYGRDDLAIDLVRLGRFAGARVLVGIVDHIDPEAKTVHLPGRPPLPYDICSIDIGITAQMDALPGFPEHGVPAKPMAVFARRWVAFCAETGPAAIVVLGGGVAGVELALAAAHRVKQIGREARVTVLDRSEILAGVAPRARARLFAALNDWGVRTEANVEVVSVAADAVELSDGRSLPSDFTIGAAGAVPHPWIARTGIETRDGFITVDPYLRSTSHPEIYGTGDCIHLGHAPRPKAGVFAVRAAPVLDQNLRAALTGAPRKRFNPQSDYLKLISLGEKKALAEKQGIALHGAAMWRWKDRIDQAFMAQFRDLKPMAPPAVPKGAAKGVAPELAGPVPCGGCGAKLGAPALLKSLGDSPLEDAAVETIGGEDIVTSHDHLRAFAEDPALVARVAALHAMGDIWAMGASPVSALAQVILPRLSDRLQGEWLSEVMETARATVEAEGAHIVGGHSTMGAELTIGFTVRGRLDRPAIRLSGAREGDALILTRGLGSGVILAAEMQMKARGVHVDALYKTLGQSQAAAARILAPHATAMTDVTGFGLAGHLHNICSASALGAALDLKAIPHLPGATELAAQGVQSSLTPQNRAALEGQITFPDTAEAALLFDPQTAGGFLAAMPATAAVTCLTALQDAGFDDAAAIGEMKAQGAGIIAA